MNEAANDMAMESADIHSASFNQYRLSWLAYFRPLIVFVSMLALSALAGGIHIAVMYAGAALAAAVLIYKIMLLKSVVLLNPKP